MVEWRVNGITEGDATFFPNISLLGSHLRVIRLILGFLLLQMNFEMEIFNGLKSTTVKHGKSRKNIHSNITFTHPKSENGSEDHFKKSFLILHTRGT